MARRILAGLGLAGFLATGGWAQEDAAAMLAPVLESRQICALGPESADCDIARGRAVAIVANAISEAGQTRDRGAFIDLVRGYLGDEAPELRAAAAYALSKLAPDATDTPVLIGLLRDPVSAVRDGAWAAAKASTDPAAQAIIERFPERVERNGYWPDPDPFDAATVGVTLPQGLEYLWLAAPQRISGELQFLSRESPQALAEAVAGLAGQSSMTSNEALARWPTAMGRLWGFQNQGLYGPVVVVPYLAGAMAEPSHYAVIYEDRLFAETGLTLIVADGRNLEPVPPPTPEQVEEPLAPLEDPAAFDSALLAASGARPEAPAEETDLYLMIRASGGAAAEAYLELYPDGAYAAEIQALIDGPRLVLDKTRYPETGPILAEVVNIPPGSIVDLAVVGPEGDVATFRAEAPTGQVSIDISGRVSLDVYRITATVSLPDSDLPLVLWRDFSVELALAELRIAKTEFAPGEVIEVDFQGMSGSDQDYVATVAAGEPLTAFLDYSYTGGAREGKLTLPAPTAPGSYELRAFFREDETILRASLPFTVGGGQAAAQPANATPAEGTAVSEADDAARATLALDQESYAPGATISVTFSGMSGAADDYVATASAGSANASYLNYSYTNGAVQGTATLTAPLEPGSYEVRAFFREDETVLRGSVAFVVEGSVPAPATPAEPDDSARATLALDKPGYAPGEPVLVTYAGMSGSTSDYVSIAAAGAPNGSYLQYAYTNGSLEGSATLQAPTEPGTYEVRAFFREDETILRGSVTFAVQ